MPITLPVATLIAGAVGGGTAAYGAHRQGVSNDRATAAQAQANAAAIAEQRRQDDMAQRQWEAEQASEAELDARQEPYRQASLDALSRMSDLLGVNLTGGAPSSSQTRPSPSSTSGPPPSIDPSKGDIAGQISTYFKSRGVDDSETPYWVSKWSEFGANDPAYFNQRLAAADIFGKSGGATTGRPTSTGLSAPPPTTSAINGPIVGPNAISPYGQTILPMSALLRRSA